MTFWPDKHPTRGIYNRVPSGRPEGGQITFGGAGVVSPPSGGGLGGGEVKLLVEYDSGGESSSSNNIKQMHDRVKDKIQNSSAKNIVEEAAHDSLGRRVRKRANFSGYEVSDPRELLDDLEAQNVRQTRDNLDLHHITYRYPDKESSPPCETACVVGTIDHEGVQILVVEVDGSSDRPNGGTFHITMSLDDGSRPVEANRIIDHHPINFLRNPISFSVTSF